MSTHNICFHGKLKKHVLCVFLDLNGHSFLSHLLVAGCDIGVRFSVRPSVSPSVRPSVNIYVDVRHLCQS